MPAERKHSGRTSTESPSTSTPISTTKTDVLVSVQPIYIDSILDRTKNHEFRKYLISTMERLWIYVSAPDQTLRYIAVVSRGKSPGQIALEDGLGNADFNNGIQREGAYLGKFAYEILHLYRIRAPLPIADLKKDYSISPPQRFSYVPENLYRAVVLEDQELIF